MQRAKPYDKRKELIGQLALEGNRAEQEIVDARIAAFRAAENVEEVRREAHRRREKIVEELYQIDEEEKKGKGLL